MRKVKVDVILLGNCCELKVSKLKATWLCKLLKEQGIETREAGTIPGAPLVIIHARSANGKSIESVKEFLSKHDDIETGETLKQVGN